MKRQHFFLGFFIAALLIVGVVTQRDRSKSKTPAPVVVPPEPKVEPPIPPSPTPTAPASAPPPIAKKTPRPKSQPPHSPASPSVTPAPAPAPPAAFVPTPPPPPPKEWQGQDTTVTRKGQVVIRNDRHWIQFWSEHHPHEAAPEVDFTREMVIGVFAGPRPADPFSIRIVGVRTLASELIVDYRERLPPTGTFAVNVTVYPYHLKVIPRSTLPIKFNALTPENTGH